MSQRKLELLSPAGSSQIAIQAILHGADAVYMGGPSHGARKSASNSLDEIATVVDFAHRYRAKVYVTVNTIVYDDEISSVRQMCRDLYNIGVDALIVQDMGLLRMNLPPIALHASTQCDIRTPEKALFLQEAGFSQLVLARELSLNEIKAITEVVSVPVECFIHGALCVSYSGRCHASFVAKGRSANRGECAQICRLPFTFADPAGQVLAKDKYLLSLKDFNLSSDLDKLIEAGVSSFKIEGRLKEEGYVKNITAYYNQLLNNIIEGNPEKLKRSSFGEVEINFEPNPYKSFNRGFTDYFLNKRKPLKIASMFTPKSLGEPVSDSRKLHNGDGISFFDKNGEYQGVNINSVEKGRIIPARKVNIPSNVQIYRTNDLEWNKKMAGKTAERRIGISMEIDKSGISCKDERGVEVRLPLNIIFDKAKSKQNLEKELSKLGNSIYYLKSFVSRIDDSLFIPPSKLSSLRRECVSLLNSANKAVYPFDYRRKENFDAVFPYKQLDYKDNVSNHLAEKFYKNHGATYIEKALEENSENVRKGNVVMTTRHCILRELGMCGKVKKGVYTLKGGNLNYNVRFNCDRCEMEIINQ